MRKTITRMLFLMLAVVSFMVLISSDPALALWAKRYDHNGWNDSGGIWPTESGGYYLWGTTSDPAEPFETKKIYLLLSKLDNSGNVQWTNKIYTGDFDHFFISELGSNKFFLQGWTSLTQGGSNSDPVWAKYTINPNSGLVTPDYRKVLRGSGQDSLGFGITEGGEIDIGTGTTKSFSGNPMDKDMLIVKQNASGGIAWSKVLNHGLDDGDPSLLPVSGGYLLCSSVANATGDGSNIVVAKLNSTGDPQWARLYVGSGYNTATIREVSGGYLLVGSSMTMIINPFSMSYSIFLIKINGSGDILWGKKYADSGILTPGMTYVNPDGSFILTGSFTDSTTQKGKILVVKLTSSGDIEWQKSFGGSGDDFGSLMKRDDGSYFLTGGSTSFSTGTSDFDVLFGKFDSNFTPQWVKAFGGDQSDLGGFFPVPNQNTYMITGETQSFGTTGGQDGVSDIFGITLNSSADYPGCNIKDVTLTETNPNITVSDLDWTQTTTTLTSRVHNLSPEDINLIIESITLTATDICTGTTEEGILTVTPGDGLNSSGTQGGPFTPSSKQYTLENTGTTSINWTAAKTQNWVTLSSPTSGTLAPGGSTTVTVSINNNANSLVVGTYNDTVTFTNTTNTSNFTTRGVGLTVNPTPGVLSVTPTEGLSSSGLPGGPFNPINKQYTLQNTGGTAINWSAMKNQNWVDLSAVSGNLAAGASTTVTVSINNNANALAPGIYNDTVTFTNTTNPTNFTTRNITLTVQGGLSVTPVEDFNSSSFEGGPFNPASKDYTLTNTGTSSISWGAAKTQAWVKLSKTSGTLAAGDSVTVNVSILLTKAKTLDAGTFNDIVTFTNKTNGLGTTTRNVILTVKAINIKLLSPAIGEKFTVCTYYPGSGPPTFQWEINGGTLKSLELQFESDPPATPPKVVKVKATATELAQKSLQIKASVWKSIFLLPGTNGGTVKWKAVGTKQNNKKVESDPPNSFEVLAPEAVGDPKINPTNKAELPTLSWENNCNSKFKVWFYNKEDYYNGTTSDGLKKTSLSFTDTDPTDNSRNFSKELTSSQWTSIQNVVGKTSGSTIYWHVESSDVVSTKRTAKSNREEFTLKD